MVPKCTGSGIGSITLIEVEWFNKILTPSRAGTGSCHGKRDHNIFILNRSHNLYKSTMPASCYRHNCNTLELKVVSTTIENIRFCQPQFQERGIFINNLEYIEGNSLPITIFVIKSNNKNFMMEIEGHKSPPRLRTNGWSSPLLKESNQHKN